MDLEEQRTEFSARVLLLLIGIDIDAGTIDRNAELKGVSIPVFFGLSAGRTPDHCLCEKPYTSGEVDPNEAGNYEWEFTLPEDFYTSKEGRKTLVCNMQPFYSIFTKLRTKKFKYNDCMDVLHDEQGWKFTYRFHYVPS